MKLVKDDRENGRNFCWIIIPFSLLHTQIIPLPSPTFYNFVIGEHGIHQQQVASRHPLLVTMATHCTGYTFFWVLGLIFFVKEVIQCKKRLHRFRRKGSKTLLARASSRRISRSWGEDLQTQSDGEDEAAWGCARQ